MFALVVVVGWDFAVLFCAALRTLWVLVIATFFFFSCSLWNIVVFANRP